MRQLAGSLFIVVALQGLPVITPAQLPPTSTPSPDSETPPTPQPLPGSQPPPPQPAPDNQTPPSPPPQNNQTPPSPQPAPDNQTPPSPPPQNNQTPPSPQPAPDNQTPPASPTPSEQPTPTPQPPQGEQNPPTPESPQDNIKQVLDAQLMANYPDGQFHPERYMSRAELAAILVKAFQLDKRASANQAAPVEVQDVPKSHWAYKDIQTMLKTGVMHGYRGKMFFPNQRVNRAEAFAIFAQAYGVFQFADSTITEILARYPDAASIPNWARKSLATVLDAGFVNTDAQGNIYPLQPITRGDMAYALSQYLDVQQRPQSF